MGYTVIESLHIGLSDPPSPFFAEERRVDMSYGNASSFILQEMGTPPPPCVVQYRRVYYSIVLREIKTVMPRAFLECGMQYHVATRPRDVVAKSTTSTFAEERHAESVIV